MGNCSGWLIRAAGLALVAGLAPGAASAGSVAVLHRFGSVPNDGYYPETDLVPDGHGNFVGGTQQGNYGGVIYRVSPTGAYSVLHAFGGGDGAIVADRVTIDAAGNIFGTTEVGGAYNGGVAYRIAADGIFSVLHNFGARKSDPQIPYGDLAVGPDGAFYGTTGYGGKFGFGTIFRMTASGRTTVLYSFQGKADGNYPDAGLAVDAHGNLYRVTYSGGYAATRAGTAWKFTAAGQLVVLHSFGDKADGGYPESAMIVDAAGNVYGCAAQSAQYGTVYEISAAGRFSTLHQFSGGDGGAPLARLLRDARGNLYGTTAAGGVARGGTVFRLSAAGRLTTLNALSEVIADEEPRAGVVMDTAGRLYGTGSGGYIDPGAVFRLSP